MANLQELRGERLRKLNELRELGVDPYTQEAKRTHQNLKLIAHFDEYENKPVQVVGRIKSIRLMGGMCFIDVADESGKIQVFTSKQKLTENHKANALGFDELKLLDMGDFVEASGSLTKTKAGEISVMSTRIRLLSKSLRPLPDEHDGLVDIETRYRQRYADLIVNPHVKHVMQVRANILQTLRTFLHGHGFVEIDTPVLQPVYGGASARPFITHHRKLDSQFFLRISDELYLKRAVVGGFEKVYEIGRDFRNESITRFHNPEFTMAELYWAYADYDDLMTLTEEMLSAIIMQVHGKLQFEYQGTKVDFKPPYRRVTFRDLIKEHTGVDIDTVTREELVKEIKQRKIEVDLKVPMKDLLDEFYKETTRVKIEQPVYLLDYPAEMIPLAKKKVDDPAKIATFQLVAMGMEFVKAYNELNDPLDQLARLQTEEKALKAGESEEAQPVDYDFIRALEIGMPPTAGWGLGIDRLTAFLTDQASIKDTIMFPTLRPEKFDPKEFSAE